MSQSSLPTDLTDAEKKLEGAVRRGEVADYRTRNKEFDHPADGANWGSERTIRAEVIYALAVGDNSDVHAKGLRIRGAKIAGALDLDSAQIPHPLALVDCFIGEPITLRDADAPLVNLTGSRVVGVQADGLRTRSGVFLRNGFHATGEVRLGGAKIGGQLDCTGGTFENALYADGATVDGDVFLRNRFHATGEVRLLAAKIGGQLDCSGGTFENAKGIALVADRATVDGDVFLRSGFRATGELRLVGARIVGNLDCQGGTFEKAKGKALNADSATVYGSVFLSSLPQAEGGLRFHATGEVLLAGAKIGGQVECSGGTFKNAEGIALNANRATVGGSVFLSIISQAGGVLRFHATGEVRLLGAKIGGQLDCSGGIFENANGHALHADSALHALNADSAIIDGPVFLGDGFHATGQVRLAGAKIGGPLNCSGGTFEKGEGFALNLERATVTGTFLLRGPRTRSAGTMNLGYANVGELVDDEESWPGNEKLYLDGFVYGRFAGDAPWQARDRLRWLGLQPGFWPQPYEQLVRVLREMGHEREAREVAIAKQVQVRKHGGLGFWGRARNLILGFVAAHGYKGERAFGLLILVWLLGTGMFCMAEWTGVMVPSEKEAYDSNQTPLVPLPSWYPILHAPLYAIDTLLPGIDLHQKSKWYLRESNSAKFSYWAFEAGGFIYFVICWLLTLIGVGAVTGLLKPH